MRYGYIRGSSTIKKKMQESEIKKFDVDAVYVDKQLKSLLSNVKQNDIVVLWRLDRLGKSLRDILSILSELNEKGVRVVGITDEFDSFRFDQVSNIINLLYNTEKQIIEARTRNGRKVAKPKGRPRLIDPKLISKAKQLQKQKKTYREIAEELQLPLSTVHYHLN